MAYIVLCEHCIMALKSHGEKVLKGDCIEFLDPTIDTCELCKLDFDPSELYECYFL